MRGIWPFILLKLQSKGIVCRIWLKFQVTLGENRLETDDDWQNEFRSSLDFDMVIMYFKTIWWRTDKHAEHTGMNLRVCNRVSQGPPSTATESHSDTRDRPGLQGCDTRSRYNYREWRYKGTTQLWAVPLRCPDRDTPNSNARRRAVTKTRVVTWTCAALREWKLIVWSYVCVTARIRTRGV